MTGRLAMLASVALLVACPANPNGPPIVFGGSTASATGGPTTADSGASDGAATDGARGDAAASNGAATVGAGNAGIPPSSSCRVQQWADAWPYLDRPADPWLAVVDGRPAPVSLPTDRTGMIGEPGAICDAAHDHCLRDCTWLVTQSTGSSFDSQATPYHVDASGTFRAARDPDQTPNPGFVAYRTVPVTRASLKVGALAMAVRAPSQDAGGHPNRGELQNGPLAVAWDVGVVESIDWDVGTLRLRGQHEPYFLSVSRLVVLRYADGGRVEPISGVDARAPAVADVIAPGRKVAVSDPWSAVGRDGQPLASTDAAALASYQDDCAGRFDHCLRPWVWFVDVGHVPAPARWTGTQFVRADDPDSPLDNPGVAYRTRPAAAADLAVGLRVIVYDLGQLPTTQLEAHRSRRAWTFVEIDSVDRTAGTFVDRDSGKRHPIDSARVLVLFWLAGDKAAKVE